VWAEWKGEQGGGEIRGGKRGGGYEGNDGRVGGK
jgi:hypothetical protein